MELTAQDEAGAYRQGGLCEACAAAREDLVWRGGRLVPVAMEKPEARHECQRHAAEAPLVALVNTVPEGLDPIGWRAAVLGLRERHVLNGQGEHADTATVLDAANLTVMLQRFALDVARGAPVKEAQQSATNSRCLAMTTAYARALAPQDPRPVPERKTGGRDVRLTVDDGRDD